MRQIETSETNDINTGLLVEVWSKGMLWDRALGYHYIPLPSVVYANEFVQFERHYFRIIILFNCSTSFTDEDGCGQWVSLDSELEMRESVVVGTKCPTGHHLLIACRFEQPFGKFLSRKHRSGGFAEKTRDVEQHYGPRGEGGTSKETATL
ncbi:hypothetical protein PV325_006190 [Microctonus aethiopoides]|nr:hypothetical protein PV325_006190 [Microctonus aethiopoides]